MATYSSNSYLSNHGTEQTANAQYILNYLCSRGWSKNAVCAMLGNMETESTINPGIWENLDDTNTSGGFGLVQWTPSTKYINWAIENGYSTYHAYSNIPAQLARIEYEFANGLQYIQTESYPISAAEFRTSNNDVAYLAMAFLYNYERPADYNQPNRGSQAQYWFNTLSVSSGGGDSGETETDPELDKLFIFPLSTYMRITQGYDGSDHVALDLGWNSEYPGANGQSIIASQAGTVVTAVDGYDNTASTGIPTYGNYVIIQHDNNIFTLYGHLAKGSVAVSVGDSVVRGQHIGNMGDSGYSFGQHLHFEVRVGGNSKSYAVNPLMFCVAPSTLYIDPNSLFYDEIIVVDFTVVKPKKKQRDGYNFVLFNRQRRMRTWHARM